MKSTRAYRMVARADSAEDTARRCRDAITRLFVQRRYEDITLAEVAAEAGVTLQTVLRRFGSKEGLVAAAAREGASQVDAERNVVEPGDVREAVANLTEHYERWGRLALRLLENEHLEAIAGHTRNGRRLHHRWVDRAFAPQLASLREPARRLRRAQLIGVTDVYSWKVLRQDLGLSPSQFEACLLDLLAQLIGGKS